MTKRLEFSPKVKLQIYRRAGGPDNVRCEKCGWKIRGRNFEIDHRAPEWTKDHIPHDERKPLTADDGWLLGNERECGCHKDKTGKESAERAHCNRIMKKQAKASESGHPMPFSRKSNLKKKFNGDIVDRNTGEILRSARR